MHQDALGEGAKFGAGGGRPPAQELQPTLDNAVLVT